MTKINHENIKAGDEVQIDNSPNWRKVYDPCYDVDWLCVFFVSAVVTSVPKSLITAHRPAKPKAYGDMVFNVPFDETFFFVDVTGEVRESRNTSPEDEKVIALGVFLTREAAEKHARKLKAIAALKQEKGARPFVAGEGNWQCFYDRDTNEIDANSWTWCESIESIWFDTEENALAAYTKHPDALWGVE